MATIVVSGLGQEVAQALKRRAATNHRSLECEVRHILTTAVEHDLSAGRQSFLALVEQLRRKTEREGHAPAEALIREDREGKRHEAKRLLRKGLRAEVETPPTEPYRSETFDLRFCPGVDPMKLNQLPDELEVDAFFENEAVDRRSGSTSAA